MLPIEGRSMNDNSKNALQCCSVELLDVYLELLCSYGLYPCAVCRELAVCSLCIAIQVIFKSCTRLYYVLNTLCAKAQD